MLHARSWQIIAAFLFATAGVSFTVGYLDARDTVAPPAATAEPPVDIVRGLVVGVENRLTVDTGQETFGYPMQEIRDVLVSSPAERSDLAVGDLVVLAVETDEFGGRAIRALVVVDPELEADDVP